MMNKEAILKEALTELINDMLAYPENYPVGAVYHVIRELEKLEEDSQDES